MKITTGPKPCTTNVWLITEAVKSSTWILWINWAVIVIAIPGFGVWSIRATSYVPVWIATPYYIGTAFKKFIPLNVQCNYRYNRYLWCRKVFTHCLTTLMLSVHEKVSVCNARCSVRFYGVYDRQTGKWRKQDDGRRERLYYITMYVASEVSSRKFPFLGGPSYIVKFAEDGQWQLLGTSLLQFTFEQGYECTIHVEKKMTDPSLADGPAWFYICREVLTKEKKDSVIPENLL